MALSGIGPDGHSAAFLTPRRDGSGVADSFRSQLRAQLLQSIAAQLPGARPAAAINGLRAESLQQSLLYKTGQTAQAASNLNLTTSGQWADLARGIGGQYLAPQTAEVFTRQMALESGNFDPDVIAGRKTSSAGAEGIAQLMPSSYPNVDRKNPVASLHAAAATMRDYLQTYGGDLRKALAAYNAGPATVSRLVASFGPRWETGLPAETRRYLRILAGDAAAGG